MKQIFYVDIYMFLNFVLHLFFLMTTAFFRQKCQKLLRMVLAAFLTAVVAVLLPFLCFRHPYLEKVLLVPEQLLLLRLGFRFEGIKTFLKDFCVLVFIAFCSGGFMTALFHFFQGIITKSSIVWIFLALIFMCLAFVLLRMELLANMNLNWKKDIYHVRIMFRKESLEAKALYDTGNRLISPYTGENVVIISKALAQHLKLETEGIQLIPYHTVGGNGLLQAFRVDSLEILEKKEKKEHVLVAVSDSIGEASGFQVIV